MKIWIKYLIGCSLGILMAFFLPANQAGVKIVVRFFNELTIRTGRYFLIPVLFFGMTISITKLRETGKLLHTGLRIALCSVVITLIGTVLGIVSGLIVKLPRIPISVEKISDPVRLDIPARLLSLFPYNGISGLLDGSFLLPMCVLAGFIGASFASDNLKAKPALVLFDSLAKISYSVLSFFTDFIAIGMIAVSCSWAIVFFDILSSSSFLGLILLLLADTLIIIAGILPFLLRTLLHENRPYKVLFAALAPLIGALFSGDTNFVLALNLRHAKDSLGIRRRISTVSLPVFSIFARSGTALVVAVSFIIVLRSYSSLDIYVSDILWLTALSFGISFCLGAFPSGGAFTALTVLCSLYGRGFESGYLLLKPAAVIICSFAAAIDAAAALCSAYYIAQREKMIMHQELKYYI
ncbi:MAG: dicarboxylate/amino acid:cation symporter [Treponema lecithinolyticum]|jgi:transporter, putative|uniref:dicarboxylate/amino acid:cation symporter n=1 Tax=Treponema lecithinolyticum TaxID=53418 RepID=UPI0036222C4E